MRVVRRMPDVLRVERTLAGTRRAESRRNARAARTGSPPAL
jgi:hypothetical protein